MPLRDMLYEKALKLLYEKGAEKLTVEAMAKTLNVQWQTLKRILDEYAKSGHVEISKMKFPFEMVVTLTEEGRKLASEMFSSDEGKLSPAEKILLAIIYAVGGQVKGATKLEKLPFLLERDYGVPLNEVYKYFAYRHGPYAKEITKAVNVLVYYGLIDVNEKVYRYEVDEDKERVIRIYTLTPKGKTLAESMFKRLPDEWKEKIRLLRIPAGKTQKSCWIMFMPNTQSLRNAQHWISSSDVTKI
jgi:DNA-binding MarR family transcriptional regulator